MHWHGPHRALHSLFISSKGCNTISQRRAAVQHFCKKSCAGTVSGFLFSWHSEGDTHTLKELCELLGVRSVSPTLRRTGWWKG